MVAGRRVVVVGMGQVGLRLCLLLRRCGMGMGSLGLAMLLGDVVICPEHTEDLLEAVVHGVLHLTGMDHETDEGEMLALQAEILGWMR